MRRIAEKLRISGLGSLTIDAWLYALLVGGYSIAVAPRFEGTTSAIVLLLALGAIASYLSQDFSNAFVPRVCGDRGNRDRSDDAGHLSAAHQRALQVRA